MDNSGKTKKGGMGWWPNCMICMDLMGWSWLKQHPTKIFNTLDYILCTKKWLENIGCFAFVTTNEHFCEQVWSLDFYVLKNVSTFYVHNFNPLRLTTKKLYIREVKLQDNVFNLKNQVLNKKVSQFQKGYYIINKYLWNCNYYTSQYCKHILTSNSKSLKFVKYISTSAFIIKI